MNPNQSPYPSRIAWGGPYMWHPQKDGTVRLYVVEDEE